ncbi:MAG: hypothetical protein HWE25_02725 [Alphaproteobacteria bacterium]|nr:hypothetical protein [Alphaproteobacteria bacterium]
MLPPLTTGWYFAPTVKTRIAEIIVLVSPVWRYVLAGMKRGVAGGICLLSGLCVGALLGGAMPTQAQADDKPVTVIMPLWGPTIEEDGTGMFVDLFRFAMQGREADYQIRFVSYDDALQQLLYGDAECAYPINKPAVLVSYQHTDGAKLLETRPVLISKSYVFSRPGEHPISSMEGIKGKLLIQIRGENYNHNFRTSQARFWNVDSELDKVKVLLEGRGDGMLGSLPDIYFSFRQLNVEIPPYDPDFPLLEYKNAMVCQASPQTDELVTYFTDRVNQTLADGSLRAETVRLGVPELIVDAFLPLRSLR